MELLVYGPARLQGTVAVSGAKNAVLPLLAASVLCERPYVIRRVPWVRDVATMLSVLGHLGIKTSWVDGDAVQVDPRGLTSHEVPPELGRSMRASFCLLGPLVARLGRATVPLPGGCRIGPRPVDLHVRELKKLGVRFREHHGLLGAQATAMEGTCLHLWTTRGPSVTGTANLLMAATAARGETLLLGVAKEPEVAQLVHFLRACGVEIEPVPGGLRVVSPGVPLSPPQGVTVIPDRIEAATWLCAAAATGGDVAIEGVVPEHLAAVSKLLSEAGAEVTESETSVRVRAERPLNAFVACARPYPGIPTDVQAQLCAVACRAVGESEIRDDVFPERWHHIDQLRRLGAQIQLQGNVARIKGPSHLKASQLQAADLRGSAALVIAALCATGRTVIHHIEHLWRGYENLPEKLRALGAHVEVEAAPDPHRMAA